MLIPRLVKIIHNPAQFGCPAINVLSAEVRPNNPFTLRVARDERISCCRINHKRFIATSLHAVHRLHLGEITQSDSSGPDFLQEIGNAASGSSCQRIRAKLRERQFDTFPQSAGSGRRCGAARGGSCRDARWWAWADSVGLRATMIDGNTSASSKICLAWPKSTTDSTQACFAEEPPQRLAVAGLHPLVRHDERQPPARLEHPQAQLVEVDVQVGHAVVGLVAALQVRLDRAEQLLPDIGRVADHHVEAAAPSKTSGKAACQSKALGCTAGSRRRCCRRGSCGRGW